MANTALYIYCRLATSKYFQQLLYLVSFKECSCEQFPSLQQLLNNLIKPADDVKIAKVWFHGQLIAALKSKLF